MKRAARPRLVIVMASLTVTVVLAVLATRGLGSGAVYYFTPAEVARGDAAPQRAIRVAGTVAAGSLRWDERKGLLRFQLTGGGARLDVVSRGAPPRLFAEGREALVEGRLVARVLRSSDVIVKHDETYRPPAEPTAR